MYLGDRLKGKLGIILKVAVIAFMVFVVIYLSVLLIVRVTKGDGAGISSEQLDQSAACQNSDVEQLLIDAGVKSPVKCK